MSCGITTDGCHDFNYGFSAVLSVTTVPVATENGFEFKGVFSPQTLVPPVIITGIYSCVYITNRI